LHTHLSELHKAVVRKFGEELQLQLLQLADFGFGLDSLGYGLDFLLDLFWLFLLGALSLERGAPPLFGY
jgi:hypothetical protein